MDISNESVEELDAEIESASTKKIEAALFLAGRFMSIQELVALTDVNPLMLKKILHDLTGKYRDAGIQIVQQNQGWKMDVASDYREMVNKLASGSSEFGTAEQETLALIAYKQPIMQSVVVKIRGNKAYDHIKRFAEMGLLNKKRKGHSAELSLTESFFEYFSLHQGDLQEENNAQPD